MCQKDPPSPIAMTKREILSPGKSRTDKPMFSDYFRTCLGNQAEDGGVLLVFWKESRTGNALPLIRPTPLRQVCSTLGFGHLEKKRRRGLEHASHGNPPMLKSELDSTWLITRSLCRWRWPSELLGAATSAILPPTTASSIGWCGLL